MTDTPGPARSFSIVAALWGLFGGLAVVAAEAFSTRALMIVLAYAAVVIGSSVAVRHADSYGQRFLLGLGTFMLATVIMYGYLAVLNPFVLGFPFWEHAWRLGFMATLGLLASAIPLALGAVAKRTIYGGA